MEPTQISSAMRMVLALSIALFLHTLMLAAMDHWPAPHREKPRTIQVMLASPEQGEVTREALQPAQPLEAAAEPEEAAPRPVQETVTAPSATETVADSDQDKTEETDERQEQQEPDPEPSPSETASAPSPASEAEVAGSRGSREGEASISQLSPDDMPDLSEYEQELWRLIAAEVRYDEIMTTLERTHTVTMELSLMRNGALRRVRVTEPSGIERLDRLAREAALIASPYPQPPPEEGRRDYQVELRFMPQ